MFQFSQSLTPLLLIAATIVGGSSLPSAAQTFPRAIRCQATIASGQGASYIYTLTGKVPNPSATIPLAPVPKATTMTVQRRDRNGRIQTLINGRSIIEFETVAPDADYSLLPFTGIFRGKSNSGHRIYSIPTGTNGLYASLRPAKGQPQQMQIVHYLNRTEYIRSAPATCRSMLNQ